MLYATGQSIEVVNQTPLW